jgi:retron-type reverse transcriptase
MKRCVVSFEEVISLENLCEAWHEFIRGKRGKKDVQEFSLRLLDELILLHEDLASGTYKHGPYHEFRINDPKPRVIHKASVRDRLLHHAIHRKLYPLFSRSFIADSFSCQKWKGVHRALDRFQTQTRKVSRNHSKTCWVLKCDIRKFFASVDHFVLAELLEAHVGDVRLLRLLHEIIGSFSVSPGKGIPLGNLTSQLFANIYMHPFDQFVKQTLRIKHYIRYADDFVFLSDDRYGLETSLPIIQRFLTEKLALDMHPDKIVLKTVASGVDFLGWVHFPYHRVLRTKTKKRMLKRIKNNPEDATLQSYLGMLGHGDAIRLSEELQCNYWLFSQPMPSFPS